MAQVFFGSPRQSRLDAKKTLPAKLDLILERLHLRNRVKGETVALKMHTGNNMGFGGRQYELIDVMPVEKIERAPLTYISAR